MPSISYWKEIAMHVKILKFIIILFLPVLLHAQPFSNLEDLVKSAMNGDKKKMQLALNEAKKLFTEHANDPSSITRITDTLQKAIEVHPVLLTDFILQNRMYYRKSVSSYLVVVKGNDFVFEDFLSESRMTVYYFTEKTCTHCHVYRPYILQLTEVKPEYVIREVDVLGWESEAQKRLMNFMRSRGQYNQFHPYVVAFRGNEPFYWGDVPGFFEYLKSKEHES